MRSLAMPWRAKPPGTMLAIPDAGANGLEAASRQSSQNGHPNTVVVRRRPQRRMRRNERERRDDSRSATMRGIHQQLAVIISRNRCAANRHGLHVTGMSVDAEQWRHVAAGRAGQWSRRTDRRRDRHRKPDVDRSIGHAGGQRRAAHGQASGPSGAAAQPSSSAESESHSVATTGSSADAVAATNAGSNTNTITGTDTGATSHAGTHSDSSALARSDARAASGACTQAP